MDFSGEITVQAARGAVFNALADAEFFASCVEGVRDLQRTDESAYAAILETKIAYIRFRFRVTVEITRIEPAEVIEAKVEGVPLGVVGRIAGASRVELADSGNGTAINYSVQVGLAGKLGAIGQPVLRAKAREMERQFAARLRAAFEEPVGAKA